MKVEKQATFTLHLSQDEADLFMGLLGIVSDPQGETYELYVALGAAGAANSGRWRIHNSSGNGNVDVHFVEEECPTWECKQEGTQ